MRRYNPVPRAYGSGALTIPITTIVEDTVHRNSQHSYFIQVADVNAYFLFQKYQACGYVLKKGARNYFRRLAPVLCTVASDEETRLEFIGKNTIDDGVARVVQTIREALNMSLDDYRKKSSHKEAFSFLRQKVEMAGIHFSCHTL